MESLFVQENRVRQNLTRLLFSYAPKKEIIPATKIITTITGST